MEITVQELCEMVRDGIVINEIGGKFFADFVEDNGDEFAISRRDSVRMLYQDLKDFGLLKGVE